MNLSYAIYYNETTPDSAECGDFSDCGLYEDGEGTLRDILRSARRCGIRGNMRNDLTRWWSSGFSVEDYGTGTEREYTLHIEGLTPNNFARINRLLNGR